MVQVSPIRACERCAIGPGFVKAAHWPRLFGPPAGCDASRWKAAVQKRGIRYAMAAVAYLRANIKLVLSKRVSWPPFANYPPTQSSTMEVRVFAGLPASAFNMRDNDYVVAMLRKSLPLSDEFASKSLLPSSALFLICGHRSLKKAMEQAAAKPAPGTPRADRAPNPSFRMKGHPAFLISLEVAGSNPLGAGKALATAFKNLRSGVYQRYRNTEKELAEARGETFNPLAHWARSMRGVGSSMSHGSKQHTTIQIYGSNMGQIGNVVAEIPATGGVARFTLSDLLPLLREFL